MIALIISALLGWFGKWRYLGLVYLLGVLVFGTAGIVGGGNEKLLFLIPLEPLGEVLLGYAVGAVWHRLRQGTWPRDAAIAGVANTVEVDPDPAHPSVRWDIETPALSYPVVRALLIVLTIAFGIIFAIFAFVSHGRLLVAMTVASIGIGVVVVLFFFVVFGILFNRLRKRFTIDEAGYRAEITDGRLAWALAASETVGTTSRNATTAGGGLLAASNLSETQKWRDVGKIVFDPQKKRLKLELGRRGWDILYCNPNVYDMVASRVRAYVSRAGAYSGAPGGSGEPPKGAG